MKFQKLVGSILLLFAAPTFAAWELDKAQQEVWDTLQTQFGHALAHEYDKHAEHVHPDFVSWGPELPVPVSWSTARPVDEMIFSGSQWLAHHMEPLTIQVRGNTAIINAIVRGVAEGPDGRRQVVLVRLHNTWIKERGRWLLFSVYNTVL